MIQAGRSNIPKLVLSGRRSSTHTLDAALVMTAFRAACESGDPYFSLDADDGAAWSAQGLADHAGISKRTAQRALASLVESGRAVRTGSGKEVRYTRPGTPVASRMLLLGLVPQR